MNADRISGRIRYSIRKLRRILPGPSAGRRPPYFLIFALLILGAIAIIKLQAPDTPEQQNQIADPLKRAQHDRDVGNLDLALEDIDSIPAASSDYIAGQELKVAILRKKKELEPPHTNAAEENCRKTVKATEEFPSTVDFKWFGAEWEIEGDSQSISVTVDYTAKNSTGAELPYRMNCWTNYDGKVEYHNRTGR